MKQLRRTIDGLANPFLLVDEGITDFALDQKLEIIHAGFEIVAFLESEIEVKIDGGTPILIRSGDVLVVPVACVQLYSVPAGSDGCRLRTLRIVFGEDFLSVGDQPGKRSASSESHRSFRQLIRRAFSEVTHLTHCLDPDLQDLIQTFREEMKFKPLGYHHRITGICYEIAVALVRRRLSTDFGGNRSGRSRSRQIVEQACNYMRQHISECQTLDRIAWEQKLSGVHLARVFKQERGQTVFQHLTWLRVERAKAMLESTTLAASEIARQCGFSSATLFGRTFKATTGRTPGNYRASIALDLIESEAPVRIPESFEIVSASNPANQ